MSIKSILIVDDNREVRLAFKTVLNYDGYHVFTAADGPEAIRLAREHVPTAILMDIDMPVMTGLQAAQALKSDCRTRDIPIVAVTGREVVEQLPWQSLFASYVQKPIGARELMGTLQRLIGSP